MTAILAARSATRGWAKRISRALAAALAASWLTLAGAVVPTPTVTGPIASPDVPGASSRNYTFWATDIILKNYGYVEEEFFFEGLANRYDARNPQGAVGNNGTTPTPTANIVTPNVPYKSRLRVIRPTDPARFNGTVIVEWTNVTNGYDTPVWEGTIYTLPDIGRVPLTTYRHWLRGDFVTTTAPPPAGYTITVGVDGYLATTANPFTMPVYLYVNPSGPRYLTSADPPPVGFGAPVLLGHLLRP